MRKSKSGPIEKLEGLAQALKARTRRDLDGEYVIEGRSGNIHASHDGYYVAVILKSRRAWNSAKEWFRSLGGELRQNGDCEGVFWLPGIPDAAGLIALRKLLRIRKVREFSPEAMRRLLERASRLWRRSRSSLVQKAIEGDMVRAEVQVN